MHWKIRNIRLLVFASARALAGGYGQPVNAQLAPPTGPSYGGSVPNSKKVVSGIMWYGMLQDGLDEAKRTGKPILLITAAAQCGSVPGMW